MRLDKYLKVSRLIKRRTVANEACDAGRVMINDKVAKASAEVKVGDIIEIIYDGSIAESYPAQITNVYGIKVVEAVAEEVIVGGDLIPMVMVNGEIYMDTGHESTVEARCGMMDGEITSTVDGTEQPTKDRKLSKIIIMVIILFPIIPP